MTQACWGVNPDQPARGSDCPNQFSSESSQGAVRTRRCHLAVPDSSWIAHGARFDLCPWTWRTTGDPGLSSPLEDEHLAKRARNMSRLPLLQAKLPSFGWPASHLGFPSLSASKRATLGTLAWEVCAGQWRQCHGKLEKLHRCLSGKRQGTRCRKVW